MYALKEAELIALKQTFYKCQTIQLEMEYQLIYIFSNGHSRF
jgi:hypothetical protein